MIPIAQDSHNGDLMLEELVAYLDGELDETANSLVERRLAEDAGYRRRLHELQRVWDLLDDLPESCAGRSFTQSTVEMVVLSATQEVERRQQFWGFWKTYASPLAALLVVLSGVVGYFLVAGRTAAPNRRLIEDLPLIEQYDTYRFAGSIEFLRQLRDQGLFGESLDDPMMAKIGVDDFTDRRRRLAQMDTNAIRELQLKKARFDAATRNQRNQVRDVYQELSASHDNLSLRQALAGYAKWLQELPSKQRAQLLALPDSQRLVAITRLVESQNKQQLVTSAPLGLAPQDAVVLYRWLSKYVVQREQEILALLPESSRARVARLEPPHRHRMMLVALCRMDPIPQLPKLSPNDVNKLLINLSPGAQRMLREAKTPEDRAKVAGEWLRAAVFSTSPVRPEQLRKFYTEGLSEEQRRRLAQLPIEQMRNELRRLFLEARRRRFGMPAIRPFADRRPGVPPSLSNKRPTGNHPAKLTPNQSPGTAAGRFDIKAGKVEQRK